MWTPDDVRARFIEAVDIELRISVKGMSACGNGWPTYRFDKEDRAGWDDIAKLDDLEKWKGRKFTTSAEQSRWQEVVFDWRLLVPIERRDLIWDFAECRARGWSFSKYCEDRGLVRMTAYRRVDRVLENLAKHFALEARSLRPASDRWVLQSIDSQDTERDINQVRVEETPAPKRPPHHPAFISEKSVDTLKTREAIDAFVAHLEDINDARRKAFIRRMKRHAPEAVSDAA